MLWHIEWLCNTKHKYSYLANREARGLSVSQCWTACTILYNDLFVFADLHVEKTKELCIELNQLSNRVCVIHDGMLNAWMAEDFLHSTWHITTAFVDATVLHLMASFLCQAITIWVKQAKNYEVKSSKVDILIRFAHIKPLTQLMLWL